MRRAQTGDILERSENNVAHVDGHGTGFPMWFIRCAKTGECSVKQATRYSTSESRYRASSSLSVAVAA